MSKMGLEESQKAAHPLKTECGKDDVSMMGAEERAETRTHILKAGGKKGNVSTRRLQEWEQTTTHHLQARQREQDGIGGTGPDGNPPSESKKAT